MSACKHMILRNSGCVVAFTEPKCLVKTFITKVSNINGDKTLYGRKIDRIYCENPTCFQHLDMKVMNEKEAEFYTQNQCSVCFEHIEKDDHYKLSGCGHVFHKSCISKWINTSNKNTCPLCREEFKSIQIDYPTMANITIILGKFRRDYLEKIFNKTKILITNDGKKIILTPKTQLELFQMCPSKWSVHDGLDMLPIYTFMGIDITAWLRSKILFEESHIVPAKIQKTLSTSVYESTSENYLFNGRYLNYSEYTETFILMFDTMHIISKEKNLKFNIVYNTKILNMIFATFNSHSVHITDLKLIAMCAIYLCHNKLFDIDYLLEFTRNEHPKHQFNNYLITVDRIRKEYGM